jgi:lipopolysaccharide export system protein LptC
MSSPIRLQAVLGGAAFALALGILAVFFYQAGSFDALMPDSAVAPPVTAEPDKTTITTSEVEGFDKDKLPFQVTAERAVQDEKEPNIVRLEKVAGTFKRVSGQLLKVTADRAVYDSAKRILDLEENVVLVLDGRVTAKLKSARVNVEDKSLRAEVPVAVAFRDGAVNANGFEISDDGKRILFLNGVKSRFGGGDKGNGEP